MRTMLIAAIAVIVVAATGVAQGPKRSLHRHKSTLPGVALPAEQVVISAPIEGLLMKLNVREGADVKRGQALAQLDDRVAKAAVAAAKCAVERRAEEAHARESLALAEKKLNRLRSVKDGRAVRAVDMEEALARRNQALASIASAIEVRQQAKRNLELEQARLERLLIRAPFDGIISRIRSHPGTTLTTAHELLHLVSLKELRAELHLPVADFGRRKVGERYEMTAGAPVNGKVVGEIVFVDRVINPATRTFRCVVTIDNRDGKLPAGFPVRIGGRRVAGNTGD